jgi:PAS domain S-box-containing protein
MIKTDQTQDFFQSVVKYGSDLITIINEDGLYTYVSDSVTRLLGYTAEEMVGTSPFVHIHEDDVSMALSYFNNLSSTDQSKLPYFRYKHKNGTWRWLDCTATNMLCNSTINGFVTNSRDITEKIEAQQTKKESQAFYEALYFNHPDLVLTLNKEGIIQNSNSKILKITGFTTDEILGKRFASLAVESSITTLQHAFFKVLSGEAQTIETQILSKNYILLDLNLTLVPVILNGTVEAIQCIAQDLTDKKRAEHLLNAQAIQLNNIMGSITESFFALDDAYCFTYTNTFFSEYIKLTPAELYGKSIWELFPNMKSTYFYEKCQEVFSQSQPVECEEYIEHMNSVLFWKIYPFENGIAVCFTDISAKQKSLEERKNLSLVASKTTNGVLITNNRGEIEWVNHSFEILTGYLLYEVIGKDPADFLYGPETQQDTIESLRRTLIRNEPCSTEFINYTKSGDVFWVALDVTPILDEDGKLLKFINIYTDITDRKQAELRLLQLSDNLFKQNRDLQQFTYIVSHNLRAPVANVVGLTKLLQKLDKNAAPYNTALTNLDKSAVRLDNVIKDLSKILSVKSDDKDGDLYEESETVIIADLITEVLQSLQETLVSINADVKLSLVTNASLDIKRAYLYSIIHNLLTNAIKYRSNERPLQVQIQCVEENEQIMIAVKDNGTGMDMTKVKPHLFKLYKRFHTDVEGKGLGLYLVKSQVEALNGQIEVESEMGVGTEFRISFKNLQYD